MKQSSIRKKLLIFMMGFVSILLLFITVFEIESDKKRSQEGLNRRIKLMRKSMNERGKIISSQIAVYTENAIASYNFFNISQIMEDMVKKNENLEYGILVDNSGLVRVHTEDHDLIETRLDSESDKFVLRQTELTVQKTEKNGVSYLEFITPISIGNNPWGFLRLGFSLAALDAEIQDFSLSEEQYLKDEISRNVSLFLLCILTGSFLIVVIAKRITNPLLQLTEFSGQLAKGNFNAKVPEEAQKANDETGLLSRTMVDMVAKLGESRAKLEDYSKSLEQEIIERKRVEDALNYKTQFIQLLQEIAVTANEASSVEEAMHICLEKICSHTGWPVGHVYETDTKQERINPTKIWHLESSSQRFETFMEVTEITSFDRGVGLPGRILESGKPLWIEDVTKTPWFLRAKSAKDIGIKSGFGFPVLEGKKVVAVLEFYSEKATEPDKSLLETLFHLAVQLGRVTERKRAEARQRVTQFAVDHSTNPVYRIRADGGIVYANAAACQLLGYTRDELTSMLVSQIGPDFPVDVWSAHWRKMKEHGSMNFEARHRTKAGQVFPVDIYTDFVVYGGEEYIWAYVYDITERKKMENEQKNFSKIFVELQEKERKRIASELHDSLAQSMMVINNEAHRIMKKHSEKPKDLDSWKLISSVALESIDEIKRISYNLRPSELDQFGLKDAVQSLVEKISSTSGIEIHKKIDLKAGSIPSAIEIQVYRIIQEGLNNVVKHSLASEAMVSIKSSNEGIHIEISDDGKGFDSNVKYENGAVTEGFGLRGINERARMFGGSLKIESTVGKGTLLKINIPIE